MTSPADVGIPAQRRPEVRARPARRRRPMEMLFHGAAARPAWPSASLFLVVLLVYVRRQGLAAAGLPALGRTSTRPAGRERAGAQSAIMGTIWVIVLTALIACRSASSPRSTWRSTPTTSAGATARSSSTSRTSPRCRRSSTASSAWASSPRQFGLGPASSPARSRCRCSSCRSSSSRSREAIRAVPQTIRDGSLALGATQWQTSGAGPAGRGARHRDRLDPGAVAGDRRGGAAAAARRGDLHHVQPGRPDQRVHRAADPDLQLDPAGRRRSSRSSPRRRSWSCS